MNFLRLLYRAGSIWLSREADIHAAALAYFVPFALTPLFLLSITLVGMLIGGNEVATLLLGWGNIIDPDLTALLDTSVRNFSVLTTSYVVPFLSVLFFSIMIIVSLNSLGSGLHKVWNVRVRGARVAIERSIRSLLFVLLLQVYLVCIIMLNRTVTYISDVPIVQLLELFYPGLIFVTTVMLITLGYGLIPVAAPSFKARFFGALVAAVMFFFTRELVAIHSAASPIPDAFGAAGLVILLLVWVYVSASIILYGAAYAAAYEESNGRLIVTK
jgi:membrane protein